MKFPPSFPALCRLWPVAAVCLLPAMAAANCADNAYLGQVCMVAYSTANGQKPCPNNALPADGRLLPIAQYHALSTLLGTYFGGDGQTTFGLPNLIGRIPIGSNPSMGMGLGQTFGNNKQTLSANTMPTHGHHLDASLLANTALGDATAPNTGKNALAGMAVQELTASGVVAAARWAAPEGDSAQTTPVAGLSISLASAGITPQPFSTQPPSFGISYCVVVIGMYPSQ